MEGLILIFFCLGLGKLVSHHAPSPAEFIRSLNLVVIRIALPALILDKIHAQSVTLDAIFPILTPWISFIATIVFVYIIKIWVPMSRATVGCLILLCGTSNTSFVGVPLLKALIGDHAIGIGLIVDQSNFIVLFTLGLTLANIYGGKSANAKLLFINLIKYPPIIALIAAIVLKPFDYPDFFQYTLATFGSLLTPLAMIAVGASLKIPKDRGVFKYFSYGLLIKLFLVPLTVLLIAKIAFTGVDPLYFNVSVLQAAMAPMVTATIIAVDKDINPELANLLTGFGIPISFITVALWHLCISGVF